MRAPAPRLSFQSSGTPDPRAIEPRVGGYSYREIGAMCGASYTNVNKHLTRARARERASTQRNRRHRSRGRVADGSPKASVPVPAIEAGAVASASSPARQSDGRVFFVR